MGAHTWSGLVTGVATKVRQVVRFLRNDGWYEAGQRGSHRYFKHPDKPGKVTVPGKPSDDLHPKTLSSILRQARIGR